MFGFKIMNRIGAAALDRLGDLNPQLLRELRGRLKWSPVLVAIGLSVLLQLGLLLSFSSQLPGKVTIDTLRLATYPQITWSPLSSFAPRFQEEVLPLDTPDRNTLASSLFIKQLTAEEPVRGDKTLGMEALKQLQAGDRLVAIAGKPLAFYEGNLSTTPPDSLTQEQMTQEQIFAKRKLANEIISRVGIYPESYQIQQYLGTTVTLTFSRPDRGEFTVTLPRVAVPNIESLPLQGRYCRINFVKTPLITLSSFCETTPDKQYYRVDWQPWCQDIFTVLTWIITFSAMVGGTFLLADNIAQEKHQGTFNFLRLSPRSAFTLLIGKLIGVPILLYLAIVVLLPLYGSAGIIAGYSPVRLAALSMTLISQTLIFYLLALLVSICITQALASALLPWLLAAGVGLFQWIMHNVHLDIDFPRTYDGLSPTVLLSFFSPKVSFTSFGPLHPRAIVEVSRFGDPNYLTNIALGVFRVNFIEYTIANLIHAVSWCALLSHALQRRFNNPGMTLLDRRYSYLLTFAGATVTLSMTNLVIYSSNAQTNILILTLMGLVYFGVLAIALTPDRQAMQDWARFRHAQAASSQRLPLWKDLLVGDRSSPIVAIVFNLLIVAPLLLGWFVIQNQAELSSGTGPLKLYAAYSAVLLFITFMLFPILFIHIQMLRQGQQKAAGSGTAGRIAQLSLLYAGLALMSWLVLYARKAEPTFVLGMPFELARLVVPLALLSGAIVVLAFIHVRQFVALGQSETQMLQRRSQPALKRRKTLVGLNGITTKSDWQALGSDARLRKVIFANDWP